MSTLKKDLIDFLAKRSSEHGKTILRNKFPEETEDQFRNRFHKPCAAYEEILVILKWLSRQESPGEAI